MTLIATVRVAVAGGTTSSWHDHPHWQGELILAGEGELWAGLSGGIGRRGRSGASPRRTGENADMAVRTTAGAQVHRLTAGRLALIPPGCPHQFAYPAGFCEWLTFRFAVAGELTAPGLTVVGENAVEAALLGALAGVAAPENRRQSEPILAALLAGAYPSAPAEAPRREPELVRRLKDEIARRADRRLTVAEAAAAIHRSPSRAAAVFRQATGGSLKNFIDRARCAAALHLLTHSDLPIAQIAAQLEFPDLYSFSRFVKQHSGRAPRAWRQATN